MVVINLVLYDNSFSQKGREVLASEDLSLGSVAPTLIKTYLEVIDTLEAKIGELEDVIEERAASLKEMQLLMSISGAASTRHY